MRKTYGVSINSADVFFVETKPRLKQLAD